MVAAPQRRLLLLRHGQACAARAGEADRDRPLSERGQQEGQTAAARLADHGLRPQLVWSSPAQRARQTALRVVEEITRLMAPSGADRATQVPDPTYESVIYEATPDALLGLLHACEADVHTLLLVGHNPGLSMLVRLLARSVSRSPVELPPGGLACLDFEAVSWAALEPSSVRALSLWPA